MRRYDVIGYASLKNNPDVVTGIVLGKDGDSVKMKVSISDAFDMARKGMINITPNTKSKKVK
jgi:hypothetical protein